MCVCCFSVCCCSCFVFYLLLLCYFFSVLVSLCVCVCGCLLLISGRFDAICFNLCRFCVGSAVAISICCNYAKTFKLHQFSRRIKCVHTLSQYSHCTMFGFSEEHRCEQSEWHIEIYTHGARKPKDTELTEGKKQQQQQKFTMPR